MIITLGKLTAITIFVSMKLTPSATYLLIAALIANVSGICQKNKIDSLRIVLKTEKEDTNRVNTLNELSFTLTDAAQNSESDSVVLATLQLAKKLDYKSGTCLAYNNIGWTCFRKGDYSKAIEYYLDAMKIAEETGDEKSLALTYHRLGTTYNMTGDDPKSLDYLSRALKIREKTGDKIGQAHTLNNLGEVYRSRYEYTKALNYYFKAFEISQKMGDKYNASVALDNIGLCYLGMGNYSVALENELKALKMCQEAGDKEGLPELYNDIGLIYLGQNDYKHALEYVNKSLAMAKEVGAMDDAKEADKALSGIYGKMGDTKNELKYYKAFISLRDSIFSQKNAEQITSAQMNFEFDKEKALEKAEQERKDLAQTEDRRKQHIILYVIYGAMIVLMLFALFVFRSLKINRRKTDIIHKQKEEVEKAFQNISALGDIGQKITATLSFEAIAETVYENVNQLMDGAIFCLGMPNKEKNTLDFPQFVENGKKFNSAYNLNDETRFPVLCFKNNMEIVINDLQNEYKKYVPYIPPPIAGDVPESFIYLPLISKGKVIGVINVGSFKKNAYTAYHLEMLRTIASYTAIALENFQTYNKLNLTLKEIEKLSVAVSRSTNTVMVFDSTLELVWVNDTFIPTMGLPMEEFKKERGRTLIEMTDHENIEALIEECVRTKSGVSYESVIATKNMGRRWFQSMMSPIFDEKGNMQNIMVIDSDITALKQIEEDLRQRNKDIVSSITYAKRLQDAILPPVSSIQKHLPESFVLYKPKDIVAGDFYWMETASVEGGEAIFIAACDCTGHGVPGAMVSVICSNALNRALFEFKMRETGKLLDKTRELVIETFEKSESEVQDGMDISFCAINIKEKKIEWSGANNPLWYVRNGEMKEIPADKQPIGKQDGERPFTSHTFDLKKGDVLYLFTDGYADQFGGPHGKKLKYKPFQEKLLSISAHAMDKQKQLLEEIHEAWKGNLEQVDDILVMGIRV